MNSAYRSECHWIWTTFLTASRGISSSTNPFKTTLSLNQFNKLDLINYSEVYNWIFKWRRYYFDAEYYYHKYKGRFKATKVYDYMYWNYIMHYVRMIMLFFSRKIFYRYKIWAWRSLKCRMQWRQAGFWRGLPFRSVFLLIIDYFFRSFVKKVFIGGLEFSLFGFGMRPELNVDSSSFIVMKSWKGWGQNAVLILNRPARQRIHKNLLVLSAGIPV